MGKKRRLGGSDRVARIAQAAKRLSSCKTYLRAQMRSITPPAGYRLTMYKLKEPPAVSSVTATTCGQYGIGLMKR